MGLFLDVLFTQKFYTQPYGVQMVKIKIFLLVLLWSGSRWKKVGAVS